VTGQNPDWAMMFSLPNVSPVASVGYGVS